MAELGYFALVLGLFTASYAFIIDVIGAWREEEALIRSGRNATISCLLCLTIAMVVLWIVLVRSDFSISYVADHTSRMLPFAYRISALWAGAAGSLLLWLWIQVAFVVFVFGGVSGNAKFFIARGRVFANLVGAFFLIVLILDKNPFSLSDPVPADGVGLNPLLQHPAMVLHPPTLFIGYAAFVIPFGWAFADLIRVNQEGLCPLFVRARNWTLLAWTFLTIGIVLGAWWAYEELGWGGYWAWDPVENSSLMPWLIATALLHCFRTYKAGSSTARWLTILSFVTFSLCIFGTFLTRYGLVSSVHAFPEPGLGILFMVLLILIWVIAVALMWWKYTHESIRPERSGWQGKIFIGLNNWLMIILTVMILIGTLFPFLSGLFAKQVSLEPEYFNKITSPFGLVLLLLLSVCPYLVRYNIDRNWRIAGAVVFGASAIGLWILTKGPAIPYFIICGFAAINLIADFFIAGSIRSLRWYGARLTHIGVVLVFVGIAGSGAYGVEKQAALTKGQSLDIGELKFLYEGLQADHGSNFTPVKAAITVSEGHQVLARLTPAQAYYNTGGRKQKTTTSEVDIKRSLGRDIYVALTGVDMNKELVNLRVLIKPLINWIWIGSGISIVGGTLILISFYRRKQTI